MALSLQVGDLDSPAPIIFHRPDEPQQQSYKPKEYINVVAYQKLGSGATGSAYKSVIEPDASSRKPAYCSFVVKLASTPYNVKRMRHEYRTYIHLHDADVVGIPTAMGFFENKAAQMAIMILSDVGIPLGRQMNKEKKVIVDREKAYVL